MASFLPSQKVESQKSLTFTFNEHLDKNGLIYWLGTDRGQRSEWTNPAPEIVKVSFSSDGGSSQGANDAIYRGTPVRQCLTGTSRPSWAMFDLGSDNSIIPSYYTIRSDSINTHFLRSWNFEGSNDDDTNKNWTVLDERRNDSTITAAGTVGSWPVAPQRTAFRFLRIFVTDNNSHGNHQLLICGFEVYGACPNHKVKVKEDHLHAFSFNSELSLSSFFDTKAFQIPPLFKYMSVKLKSFDMPIYLRSSELKELQQLLSCPAIDEDEKQELFESDTKNESNEIQLSELPVSSTASALFEIIQQTVSPSDKVVLLTSLIDILKRNRTTVADFQGLLDIFFNTETGLLFSKSESKRSECGLLLHQLMLFDARASDFVSGNLHTLGKAMRRDDVSDPIFDLVSVICPILKASPNGSQFQQFNISCTDSDVRSIATIFRINDTTSTDVGYNFMDLVQAFIFLDISSLNSTSMLKFLEIALFLIEKSFAELEESVTTDLNSDEKKTDEKNEKNIPPETDELVNINNHIDFDFCTSSQTKTVTKKALLDPNPTQFIELQNVTDGMWFDVILPKDFNWDFVQLKIHDFDTFTPKNITVTVHRHSRNSDGSFVDKVIYSTTHELPQKPESNTSNDEWMNILDASLITNKVDITNGLRVTIKITSLYSPAPFNEVKLCRIAALRVLVKCSNLKPGVSVISSSLLSSSSLAPLFAFNIFQRLCAICVFEFDKIRVDQNEFSQVPTLVCVSNILKLLQSGWPKLFTRIIEPIYIWTFQMRCTIAANLFLYRLKLGYDQLSPLDCSDALDQLWTTELEISKRFSCSREISTALQTIFISCVIFPVAKSLFDVDSFNWINFQVKLEGLISHYDACSPYSTKIRNLFRLIVLFSSKQFKTACNKMWRDIVSDKVSRQLRDLLADRNQINTKDEFEFVDQVQEMIHRIHIASTSNQSLFNAATEEGFQRAYRRLPKELAAEMMYRIAHFLNVILDIGSPEKEPFVDAFIRNSDKSIDRACNIIKTFQSIQDFTHFYELTLARRLIRNRYISLRIENDVLRRIDYSSSINRARKMLTDLQFTHSLQTPFMKYCFELYDRTNSLGCKGEILNTYGHLAEHFNSYLLQMISSKRFIVTFLTSGVWPSTAVSTKKLKLPNNLQLVCDLFEQFFRNSSLYNKSLQLIWCPTSGVSVIIMKLNSERKVNLVLSPVQMCILLLFNQKNSWTIQQISEELGLLIEDVEQGVLSLTAKAHPILRVAGNQNQSCSSSDELFHSISSSDNLEVNIDFSPSKERNIMIHSVIDKKAQDIAELAQVFAWRQQIVDATIVKTVKKAPERKISLNEAVAQIRSHLNEKFSISFKDVILRINKLCCDGIIDQVSSVSANGEVILSYLPDENTTSSNFNFAKTIGNLKDTTSVFGKHLFQLMVYRFESDVQKKNEEKSDNENNQDLVSVNYTQFHEGLIRTILRRNVSVLPVSTPISNWYWNVPCFQILWSLRDFASNTLLNESEALIRQVKRYVSPEIQIHFDNFKSFLEEKNLFKSMFIDENKRIGSPESGLSVSELSSIISIFMLEHLPILWDIYQKINLIFEKVPYDEIEALFSGLAVIKALIVASEQKIGISIKEMHAKMIPIAFTEFCLMMRSIYALTVPPICDEVPNIKNVLTQLQEHFKKLFHEMTYNFVITKCRLKNIDLLPFQEPNRRNLSTEELLYGILDFQFSEKILFKLSSAMEDCNGILNSMDTEIMYSSSINMKAFSLALFEEMDSNKDGLLTVSEFDIVNKFNHASGMSKTGDYQNSNFCMEKDDDIKDDDISEIPTLNIKRQYSTAGILHDDRLFISLESKHFAQLNDVFSKVDEEYKILEKNVAQVLKVPCAHAMQLLLCNSFNSELIINRMMHNEPFTRFDAGLPPRGSSGIIEIGYDKQPSTCACSICFETELGPEEKFVSLQCEHFFCSTCWCQYIKTKVVDDRQVRIQCPIPKCNSAVTTDLFFQVNLSPEVIQAHRRLVLRNCKEGKTVGQSQVVFCKNPKGCEGVILLEPSPLPQTVECSECVHQFCSMCDLPPHSPTICSLMQRWIDKNGYYVSVSKEDLENKKIKQKTTKPCPKCGIPIEKNGGCSHMTCHASEGGCGYEFCWHCLGPYHTTGSCDRPIDIGNPGSHIHFKQMDEQCADYFTGADSTKVRIEVLLESIQNLIDPEILKNINLLCDCLETIKRSQLALAHFCISDFFLPEGNIRKKIEFQSNQLKKCLENVLKMCHNQWQLFRAPAESLGLNMSLLAEVQQSVNILKQQLERFLAEIPGQIVAIIETDSKKTNTNSNNVGTIPCEICGMNVQATSFKQHITVQHTSLQTEQTVKYGFGATHDSYILLGSKESSLIPGIVFPQISSKDGKFILDSSVSGVSPSQLPHANIQIRINLEEEGKNEEQNVTNTLLPFNQTHIENNNNNNNNNDDDDDDDEEEEVDGNSELYQSNDY